MEHSAFRQGIDGLSTSGRVALGIDLGVAIAYVLSKLMMLLNQLPVSRGSVIVDIFFLVSFGVATVVFVRDFKRVLDALLDEAKMHASERITHISDYGVRPGARAATLQRRMVADAVDRYMKKPHTR